MPTLKIETVSIDTVIPYINNAKLHPAEQIDQIAASIKEFGFNDPIAIDGDDVIIEGHGRLLAAQKLGMDTVPIIRLDHLTPAQRKAYTLAHNKLTMNTDFDLDVLRVEIESLLEMDFQVDLAGFDEAEVARLLNEENEPEPAGDLDEIPTIQKATMTEPGDLYEIGPHRLLCGDSTRLQDLDRLMDGRKIDLLITDPPYGVSYADKNRFLNSISPGNRIQKEIENDHCSSGELKRFCEMVFENAAKFMNDPSSYYVFAPQGGEQMMMMMALDSSGFQVKHELIWVKNNHVLGRSDYNYKHEPVIYGWPKGKTHKFYAKDHKTSLLSFDKPLKSDLHPTMKPVSLLGELISNSTERQNLILDLFGGLGTTMVAANQLSRIALLLELDPHYCDVIVNRMRGLFPDLAIKRNGELLEL